VYGAVIEILFLLLLVWKLCNVSIMLLTRATFCVVLFVFLCLLVDLVRLSVAVQVIDWKDL